MATGTTVADPALAAAGPVGPGEVAGLADQLVPGRPGAPQLGAGLHEGAGPGPGPEGQLALALQVVAKAGEAGGQGQLLLGLVQETVTWGDTRVKGQSSPSQDRLAFQLRGPSEGSNQPNGSSVTRFQGRLELAM